MLKAFYCNANELTTLDVSGYKVLKFFDCSGNKINGENMEALVNSLPTVDYGIFWACNESRFPDNVITAAQVNIATDKGWEVMSICSTEKDGYAGQGDINGDKKIDLADLELLENIIMGRAENIDEYTGDVNKDGKTDAADIVTLVNILNGK